MIRWLSGRPASTGMAAVRAEAAAVAGDRSGEGVQDHGQPDLELIAEVIAGTQDLLGRHLGEVGVLADELLHDCFDGLGDGLRVER
jgi:hypothetical protein